MEVSNTVSVAMAITPEQRESLSNKMPNWFSLFLICADNYNIREKGGKLTAIPREFLDLIC